MPDLTKLQFYSGTNYLKRSEFWGEVEATEQGVEIDHNLGYIPQIVYAVNFRNDGVWWMDTNYGKRIQASNSFVDGENVSVYVDTTKIVFRMIPSRTTAPPPSIRVRYGIYLDR